MLAQGRQFGVDRFLEFGRCVAGARRHLDQEGRAQRTRILVGVHVLGDLAPVDERFIQPARLAAGEDLRGNRKFGVAWLVSRGRKPAHVHARQLDPVRHHQALFLGDGRRRHLRAHHRRSAAQATEVFRHQRARFRLVDVAGNHDAGIVRAIVAGEEVAHVVQLRVLDVGVRADHRGPVRVVLGEQRLVERLLDDPVGLVLDALAALVAHHVLLVGERLLVQHVEQVAHAVGMHPEGEFELVRGHRVVVIGAVVVGAAVAVAGAGALQQAVGQAARQVLAAGEHHVLEQVGEAGQAGHLVGRADVVPDVDGHQRQALVFDQDHLQAVGQRVLVEGDGRDAGHVVAGGGSGVRGGGAAGLCAGAIQGGHQ